MRTPHLGLRECTCVGPRLHAQVRNSNEFAVTIINGIVDSKYGAHDEGII